ncbi:MAG: hypothetical protein LBV17_12180, partial [Treponema sp.]|nr:hypothetical protein [Treponema sp.]
MPETKNVKIIKEIDTSKTRNIESIEGKQLNEFATLEVKPEIFFETGSKIRSAVIADNGKLFLGNENCEFYAIDIATKQKLWTYSADLAVQTWP